MRKITILLIFVFLNLILGVLSNCGQTPSIIFNEDGEEDGKRVLIKRQDELCEWTWSDPYTPLDAKFLQHGSKIKLKALLDQGDGAAIRRGEPGDWILEYIISYTLPSEDSKQVECQGKLERRVRILKYAVNPCEKEATPCAKNGIAFSSTCSYDPDYKGCKKCECKFGCQAGQGGAEFSCVDRNMCNIYYNKCHLNTTCSDLICPESFKCTCNKGFDTVREEKFNCLSDEDCRNAQSETVCTNKNECLAQYNCPEGSECVDNWPEEGGCNSDPYYPNKYPQYYNFQRCGYSCRCKEGYEMESINPLMCKRVCTKKCPPLSKCILDIFGKERCECQTGYTYNPELNVCEPDNPCLRPNDCHVKLPGSICKNISPGQYICVCPEGTREMEGKQHFHPFFSHLFNIFSLFSSPINTFYLQEDAERTIDVFWDNTTV